VREARAIVGLMWVALGAACATETPDVTGDPPLILSDTAEAVSPALSRLAVATADAPLTPSTSEDAGLTQVAYVSLPPGSIANSVAAVIRNRRTVIGLMTFMINGGFDPVPISAIPGDTLDIDIQKAGAATSLRVVRTVPGKRPPRVVRTHPPRGKRDVALNTTIMVVFSEPIDAASLSETSVRLLRGGTGVAGRLAFGDTAHLTAVFTPLAPLERGTDYQFVVTQDVRDLDGERLESTPPVDFSTVALASTAPAQRIAFADWATISTINVDGTGLTSVIDDDGQGWTYMSPAWSPDGSKIAFGSSRDGGWDIYVINADGSGLRRLTNHVARDDSPAWSPDGTKIAFTSDRDGDFEIHVMNEDGSGVRRVADHPAQDGDPSWSPDGRRIAFTSDRDGFNEIYVINADGTGTQRLTSFSDPQEAIQPSWSPDGTMLAYTVVNGSAGIWVTTAAGGVSAQLTYGGGGAPTWSPDGRFIVYASGNLQVMNSSGGERRDLRVFGYEPAWSPVLR
jgi:hypothetical protein